jgi:hypothetical protein
VSWHGKLQFIKNIDANGDVQIELARRGGVVTGAITLVKADELRRVDSLINTAAASVNGDDWNKETALRLEREYAAVKPDLELLSGELIDGTRDDSYTVPESWDMLSDEQQTETEDKWKSDSHASFLQEEQNSWVENGDAARDANREVAEDFTTQLDEVYDQLITGKIVNPNMELGSSWFEEALMDYLDERKENDEPPLPFAPIQLLAAMKFNGGEYGEYEDCDLEFSDDKLDKLFDAAHGGEAEPELPTPGLGPKQASKALTQEMRDDLAAAMLDAFKKEAERAADDMEPPGYLEDSIGEMQDDYWGGFADEEKFAKAKEFGVIDDGPVEVDGKIVLPTKFDPLQETSGTDYARTQAFARAMFYKRAAQLIQERGLVDDASLPNSGDIRATDNWLWEEWKDSSTSQGGLAIQLAAAEELGGRMRKETLEHVSSSEADVRRSAADHLARSISEDPAKRWEAIKAMMRAKWETSQYMLDKAGIQQLQLYRGIELEGKPSTPLGVRELLALPEKDKWRTQLYGGMWNKLPYMTVHRNGALSTSTDRYVANNWRASADGKATMRIAAPRTAVISVPAYGINMAFEHEVVVGGTAWKDWDAWAGSAPEYPSRGMNGAGEESTLGVPIAASQSDADKAREKEAIDVLAKEKESIEQSKLKKSAALATHQFEPGDKIIWSGVGGIVTGYGPDGEVEFTSKAGVPMKSFEGPSIKLIEKGTYKAAKPSPAGYSTPKFDKGDHVWTLPKNAGGWVDDKEFVVVSSNIPTMPDHVVVVAPEHVGSVAEVAHQIAIDKESLGMKTAEPATPSLFKKGEIVKLKSGIKAKVVTELPSSNAWVQPIYEDGSTGPSMLVSSIAVAEPEEEHVEA